MVIKSVYRLKNDTVMVFDAEGEQVPEYQGRYEDVKGSILREVPPDAVLSHWFDGAMEPEVVTKENW